MSRPIYLDYNATTPLAPEVAAALIDAWRKIAELARAPVRLTSTDA